MFGSQRTQCGAVSQCLGDRDTGSEIKLIRKIQTLEFPSHKPMIQFNAHGEKKLPKFIQVTFPLSNPKEVLVTQHRSMWAENPYAHTYNISTWGEAEAGGWP